MVIRTNTPHLNAAGKGDMMNPAPTPEQQEQDALRLGKVRELINSWVTTTGMNVLIAPEALKEIKYARTMLYDQLDERVKAKVACRESFWSADEAMSVYARAHTMFGMEPHSLIMCLALGVPVVHAVHSNMAGRSGCFGILAYRSGFLRLIKPPHPISREPFYQFIKITKRAK